MGEGFEDWFLVGGIQKGVVRGGPYMSHGVEALRWVIDHQPSNGSCLTWQLGQIEALCALAREEGRLALTFPSSPTMGKGRMCWGPWETLTDWAWPC